MAPRRDFVSFLDPSRVQKSPPSASDVEKRLRAQTRFFEERPLGASVPSRTPFSMNFGSPGSLLDNFLKPFLMIFRWNSESSCLLFSALSPSRFLSYSLCLGIFPNGFPELFSVMVFPSCFPLLFSPVVFPSCFPSCFPWLFHPVVFPSGFPQLFSEVVSSNGFPRWFS